MTEPATAVRGGEYAARGDYHRTPDRDWDYLPTYLAKLEYVRRHLDRLPAGTRVLDAGCGEGVLVEEYRSRLAIRGHRPELLLAVACDREACSHCRGKPERLTAPCVSTSWSTWISTRSQERADRAPPRPPAGGHTPRLRAEPRPPAVARAFPAARPADPHSKRAEAPGRQARGGVPAPLCRRGLRARARRGHLPDPSGRHRNHPTAPGPARLASPAADATPAGPRLVLPEPVRVAPGRAAGSEVRHPVTARTERLLPCSPA